MPSILQCIIQGSLAESLFEHVNGLEAVVTGWIAAGSPLHPVIQDHKSPTPKPYTVSPIFPCDNGLSLFYLTLLDDNLEEIVYKGINETGKRIRLGEEIYSLTAIPSIIMTETWEEIMAQAIHNPQTQWAFEMLTPTATSGKPGYDKQCPTPAPETYFASWLHRWRHCAPPPYNELFDELDIHDFLDTGVAVSFFSGKTEIVKIYKKKRFCPFIGFVGSTGFRVLNGVNDREKVAALNALARLAPYCGTGKETMRGMGQTRLLE